MKGKVATVTELGEIDYTDQEIVEEIEQYAKDFAEEELWRAYIDSFDVDPAEDPEEDDYDGSLNLQKAAYFVREDERLFVESGGNMESPEYAMLQAKLSNLEYRYEQSINPDED
jgi:hypothetical protein